MKIFENLVDVPLVDTHEHLKSESVFLQQGPDILQDLFGNYVRADLLSAGMSEEALNSAVNTPQSLSLEQRWALIEPYWQYVQHTGYGLAVRRIAKDAYQIDEITFDALNSAELQNKNYRRPGMRERILRESGNIIKVQVNHEEFRIPREDSDFFSYDLRCYELTCGKIHSDLLKGFYPKSITDLDSLERAINFYFQYEARHAVAIKMQYAYERSLQWKKPNLVDVKKSLQRVLRKKQASQSDYSTVGDWCVQKCVDLALEFNLPVKIHTGYLAGGSGFPMHMDVSPRLLLDLIQDNPKARFVLFHLGYPYQNELVAMVKRLPNVFIDMCWAWAIDPMVSQQALRTLVHSVPMNKIFLFGGDTSWPNAAVAYANEMRKWFAGVLTQEISAGFMDEDEAKELAQRLMNKNQLEFYYQERG